MNPATTIVFGPAKEATPASSTYPLIFYFDDAATNVAVNVISTVGPAVFQLWADGVQEAVYDTDTMTHTFSGAADKFMAISPAGDNWADLISISLNNKQLIKNIPSSIGRLQHITNLDLGDNDFTSPLPPEIFDIDDLEVLIVSQNANLPGGIPSTVNNAAATLQRLRFENCSFDQALPAELWDCVNLIAVQVQGNEIPGTLSAGMGNLSQCQNFFANNNLLTGAIPTAISGMTSLIDLRLQNNQMDALELGINACLNLQTLLIQDNIISTYEVGALATQPKLSLINMSTNSLNQAAVDAVLADLVTSLSVPARVVATVQLQGNTAPSAAGLNDVNTLVAAGWTVSHD